MNIEVRVRDEDDEAGYKGWHKQTAHFSCNGNISKDETDRSETKEFWDICSHRESCPLLEVPADYANANDCAEVKSFKRVYGVEDKDIRQAAKDNAIFAVLTQRVFAS
ncbi:MAG: hypothetical protein LBH41_00800 [Rickettsiales bacterium]|jgi:hypothetical protein|nr:hypothetical protein [Rickettsiales bacterium]